MSTSPATAPLQTADYPALFQAANTASVKAQSSYFAVLRLEMYLLIVGALLGSLVGFRADFTKWALIGSVLALVIGLSVSLISRQRRYEQQWFNCRAVSETVKSLTWRYVTKASPLQQGSVKEADAALGTAIADLLKDWKDRVNLASSEGGSSQRTGRMRTVRESSLQDRLDAYRTGRLIDQQRWYSRRGREHDRSESRWFILASLAQAFAVAIAVVSLKQDLPLRPIGVLATIASAAFAWSKAKRFREFSSAYSMAAQELAVAEGQVEHVTSEEELAKLVEDVEERISREHTTWRARSI